MKAEEIYMASLKITEKTNYPHYHVFYQNGFHFNVET